MLTLSHLFLGGEMRNCFFYLKWSSVNWVLVNAEKIKRSWLMYSNRNDSLHCFCCYMFSPKEYSLNKEGLKDWNNASHLLNVMRIAGTTVPTWQHGRRWRSFPGACSTSLDMKSAMFRHAWSQMCLAQSHRTNHSHMLFFQPNEGTFTHTPPSYHHQRMAFPAYWCWLLPTAAHLSGSPIKSVISDRL